MESFLTKWERVIKSVPEKRKAEPLVYMPEDPDERRMFNEAADLYGGPLEAIRMNLMVMSGAAPQNGSYAKMLAIWANEITSAIERR